MKFDIRETFLIHELENTFNRLLINNQVEETEKLRKHLNWLESELEKIAKEESSND